MNFIKRILQAWTAAHSQVWLSWEETASWTFMAHPQKVKLTIFPLFPAHVFSLVAIPRKRGVWKSSCYTSWLKVKPNFLILLKWCLRGSALNAEARWPSARADGERRPCSHPHTGKSVQEQKHPLQHADIHLITRNKLLDRRTYIPCRRD